ncbi:MAG: histone deacetylase [candidate division KSB1 bacterium]|nr:histone deacetylase [candidate division KSB1 bacterium]MDQ7063134.1 histone deacetylase [candidate division KSB1 bacterium]
MNTAIFYDDLFLAHDTQNGHPENANRLRAIRRRLEEAGLWQPLLRPIQERCSRDFLEVNHTRQHIQRIVSACENAPASLDPDTLVSARSYDAALLAVNALVEATNAVMAGELNNAFCAVRPPGHHAEKDRAMGFCLFNNIALAAHNLLHHHHLERVLIIDWDVHHGNGTQQAFYDNRQVYFLSLHQWPLYPGTGRPDEIGSGEGTGFNRNVIFAPGTPAEEYMQKFEEVIPDVFQTFSPQFVLISAGFDAHRDDPLAQLQLTEDNFAAMTRLVLTLAREHCDGRVVSSLEGGYNLAALAGSVLAHVTELMQYEA